MDTLSSGERRHVMSRIRNKNTKPELIARRLLHSLGYRYRIHVPNLVGKPDLVFTARHSSILFRGRTVLPALAVPFVSRGSSIPSPAPLVTGLDGTGRMVLSGFTG